MKYDARKVSIEFHKADALRELRPHLDASGRKERKGRPARSKLRVPVVCYLTRILFAHMEAFLESDPLPLDADLESLTDGALKEAREQVKHPVVDRIAGMFRIYFMDMARARYLGELARRTKAPSSSRLQAYDQPDYKKWAIEACAGFQAGSGSRTEATDQKRNLQARKTDRRKPDPGNLPAESKRDKITLDEQKGDACIFRKVTKVWTLCFGGKIAHVADLAGMNYIAELLRRPRAPIDADILIGTVRENVNPPAKVSERKNVDASAKVSEQRVVLTGAAMPGLPRADAKAIKSVKAALAKRKAELKDFPTNDPATDNLRREVSQLENYLAQVTGKHGGLRKTGGITERARSRVTHAISRAIDKIAEQLPALAKHLQDSISTGTSLIYTPTELPDWQF
jgi:hypothetical protein